MTKTIKSSVVMSCVALAAAVLMNVLMPFESFAQNQGGGS